MLKPCKACQERRKAMAAKARKLMQPVKGAYSKFIKPKGNSK